MKVLACSTSWQLANGIPECLGEFHQVEADHIPKGISVEDAQILAGHAIEFFAIVCAALLVRKALL